MPKLAVLLVFTFFAVAGASAQPAPPPVSPQEMVTAEPSDAPLGRSTSSAVDAESLPSFGSLFRDLGRDFRRLPSWETATILGVAGGVSLAVHPRDSELTRQAVGSRNLDTLFEAGDLMGGGVMQYGAAFATYTLGRVSHSPRVTRLGADLVRAQIVGSVLTQGLKIAIDRPRPDGGRFSFPSGHSSGAFATATVIQRHFGWRVGVPAYALATYVAGSRLQENRHFMSDVIFGAAIGIVSARAVTVGHGRATFAVAPFATGGGGGIGFTLVPSSRPARRPTK